MKNLNIVILSMLMTVSANASCPGKNYEGVFRNPIGDRFQVTQPNCDLFWVKDLQTRQEFKIDLKNPANPVDLVPLLNRMGYLFNQTIPVTVSYFDPRTLDPYYPENALAFEFKAALRLKKLAKNEGLKSPMIRMKFVIYPMFPSNDNRAIDAFYAYLSNPEAIAQPGDSWAQKAFIRGFNIALDIMEKYFFSSTLFDYMSRDDGRQNQ